MYALFRRHRTAKWLWNEFTPISISQTTTSHHNRSSSNEYDTVQVHFSHDNEMTPTKIARTQKNKPNALTLLGKKTQTHTENPFWMCFFLPFDAFSRSRSRLQQINMCKNSLFGVYRYGKYTIARGKHTRRTIENETITKTWTERIIFVDAARQNIEFHLKFFCIGQNSCNASRYLNAVFTIRSQKISTFLWI